MNNTWKSQKSPLKIYLITVSLVIGIVILVINFKVLPQLMEVISEVSPAQAETMKNQLFNIMIGTLAFIFLANFYFWRIENKLEKEEKEAQKILEINPGDSASKERLEKVERKRKYYIAIIEPAFMVILGLIIGFLTYTILTPLYSLIGR